jgi:hypothetical protein
MKRWPAFFASLAIGIGLAIGPITAAEPPTVIRGPGSGSVEPQPAADLDLPTVLRGPGSRSVEPQSIPAAATLGCPDGYYVDGADLCSPYSWNSVTTCGSNCQ